MKVLFAVDGSACSFDAVAEVGLLLRAEQDQIAIYCSPPSTETLSTLGNAEMLERAQKSLLDVIFTETRKRFPSALQPTVQTIVGEGDPRHDIVTVAEQWEANLIVVGARGLGRLERLFLGSVSRAVAHASNIPVWVSRASLRKLEVDTPRNVLLACEDPATGCRQSELLSNFAWPPGSVCHTLTVVPSMFAGKVPDWLQQQARSPDVEEMVQAWAREHDEQLASTRAKMADFSLTLPEGLKRCEPQVVEGETASVIVNQIAQAKIDLAVIGAYRKNWLAATLLSRTSDAVLNQASCSVLIVPHHPTS